MKLYVEGGGDSSTLKSECREAFTKFITAAGVSNRPRIVACGGRRNAYESFCTAISMDEAAMLLVDSEAAVSALHQVGQPDSWLPWAHLKHRDNWEMPVGSKNMDCHLMVQIMESWFLADRRTLSSYFKALKINKLPANERQIEGVAKLEVYEALKKATADCARENQYDKGDHSFKVLRRINSQTVLDASPWAKRFIDALKK